MNPFETRLQCLNIARDDFNCGIKTNSDYEDAVLDRAYKYYQFINANFEELGLVPSKNFAAINFEDFAKCCTIMHPKHGKLTFNPYKYQLKMVENVIKEEKILINSGRQLGTTSTLSHYAFWEAVRSPKKKILIMGHKFTVAECIREYILTSINYFNEDKPEMRFNSKNRIEFTNGSVIHFFGANSKLPDHDVMPEYDLVWFDNAAYFPPDRLEELLEDEVKFKKGGKTIISSCPHRASGPFYDIYLGTKKYGEYSTLELPFYVHPDRDAEWEKEQRGYIGDEAFEQQHNCKFTAV